MAEYKAPVLWMMLIGLAAIAPLVSIHPAVPVTVIRPATYRPPAMEAPATSVLGRDLAEALVVVAHESGLPHSFVIRPLRTRYQSAVGIDDAVTGRQVARIDWNPGGYGSPIFETTGPPPDLGNMKKERFATLAETFFSQEVVRSHLDVDSRIEWRESGDELVFKLTGEDGLPQVGVAVNRNTGQVTSQSLSENLDESAEGAETVGVEFRPS